MAVRALIFSGNQQEADDFGAKNGWAPGEAVFVASPQTLNGYNLGIVPMHVTGTFYQRPDWVEVVNATGQMRTLLR